MDRDGGEDQRHAQHGERIHPDGQGAGVFVRRRSASNCRSASGQIAFIGEVEELLRGLLAPGRSNTATDCNRRDDLESCFPGLVALEELFRDIRHAAPRAESASSRDAKRSRWKRNLA